MARAYTYGSDTRFSDCERLPCGLPGAWVPECPNTENRFIVAGFCAGFCRRAEYLNESYRVELSTRRTGIGIMKTHHAEIEIVHHDRNKWRYRIDGHFTGPVMATRGEAFAYLDRQAADYGIISPRELTDNIQETVSRSISTLENTVVDRAVVDSVIQDLRAALNLKP